MEPLFSSVLPLKDKHYFSTQFSLNPENCEVHAQFYVSLNSLYSVSADKLTHAPEVKNFHVLKLAASLSPS